MSDGANIDAATGAAGSPRRLGDLLVEAQLVTGEQLDVARKEQEKTGAFLAKILVQSDYLTQDDLNACFVKRCKIPHISLLDYDIDNDVLALVPREICLKHGLLPIDKLGRILTVAMVDPLDEVALDTVRETRPELRIKPILCNWAHFEQVTKKYLTSGNSDGKGGRNMAQMSAASLGLGAAASKPTPKPVVGADPGSPPAGGGSPGGAVDTGALVAAIQAGFAGVARDMAAQRDAGPNATGDATPAAFPVESMAQAIQQSMRDVLDEVLARESGAPETAAQAAPDFSGLEASFRAAVDELKSVVRGSVAPATSENAPADSPAPMPAEMSETLQRLAQALDREPAQPAGEAMAEVIRDSVGGAMQEALAAVMVRLRAHESSAGGASLEPVLAAVRESQAGMVSSLQEILSAGQQSQELQGARLAAIAEAAVESSQQTSQLIEATLVRNERSGSLSRGRTPHASVSAFGLPASDEDAQLHAEADEEVRDALASETPLETLTFDRFFPGDANAFTTKICQAVAAKPGAEHNPLFLYGNVGLGKTHLVSAVGNLIKDKNPRHRVGYVSASHFARRLKEATAAEAQDAFRDNYCHWDVLILDDIQFMGGRVEAQEEFFHIFNVLHQRGRQIIIASDKAPDRLGLLERRLISRFSSGIVAELKPPEWETRMKILRHHLQASGATLPDEICSLVAMRVSGDVRKMVGALRKIAAFSSLSEGPVSVEMATEILSHIGGEEAA